MSQYTAQIPTDGSVKPEIVRFFERFYEISDTPQGHETYADQFTADGKLIMATNEANGRDEIIQMRHGMWEKVARRSHRPLQIYAFGPGANEVMLQGDVGYELKDGRKTTVEWAARAIFVGDDGALKMKFYQVYLDTAAVAKAK